MTIQLIDTGALAGPVYHCPECKKVPAYGFHLNGGDLGIVGIVEYFTVFCANETKPANPVTGDKASICGAILGVNIMRHHPPRDPALRAQLEAMIQSGIAGGGRKQ